MEAVLETLELAERQKNADEQEIETLRRGLRQLHRPKNAASIRRGTETRINRTAQLWISPGAGLAHPRHSEL